MSALAVAILIRLQLAVGATAEENASSERPSCSTLDDDGPCRFPFTTPDNRTFHGCKPFNDVLITGFTCPLPPVSMKNYFGTTVLTVLQASFQNGTHAFCGRDCPVDCGDGELRKQVKKKIHSRVIKRHFFRRIPCTVVTGNAAAWKSAAKANASTAVGSAPLLAPASPTTTSARGTARRGGSGAGRRHAGETQGSCARDCSCSTWCR